MFLKRLIVDYGVNVLTVKAILLVRQLEAIVSIRRPIFNRWSYMWDLK